MGPALVQWSPPPPAAEPKFQVSAAQQCTSPAQGAKALSGRRARDTGAQWLKRQQEVPQWEKQAEKARGNYSCPETAVSLGEIGTFVPALSSRAPAQGFVYKQAGNRIESSEALPKNQTKPNKTPCVISSSLRHSQRHWRF